MEIYKSSINDKENRILIKPEEDCCSHARGTVGKDLYSVALTALFIELLSSFLFVGFDKGQKAGRNEKGDHGQPEQEAAAEVNNGAKHHCRHKAAKAQGLFFIGCKANDGAQKNAE